MPTTRAIERRSEKRTSRTAASMKTELSLSTIISMPCGRFGCISAMTPLTPRIIDRVLAVDWRLMPRPTTLLPSAVKLSRSVSGAISTRATSPSRTR